ncbi:hypothetical protein B0H19DRAFT_1269632 [Mycena capillaripes]|nr:hypothetical protein B0H19DRAFT_1269632 [Mycena capillaripes]
MKEVIDLTGDSPPPRRRTDVKEAKRARREKRAKRNADERAIIRKFNERETARNGQVLPSDSHPPRDDKEHGYDADEGNEREAARNGLQPDSHSSRDDREHGHNADERKRRREHSREREREPGYDRKRSRRRDRERERDPPIPDDQLFFIDKTPVPLPSAARHTAATTVEEPPGLILPAHVSVFGEIPTVILPVETLDSDEDDYIEYLDYDNRKDFVRYYEEEPQEKRTKIVCKKCGAEGEHTTAECPVLIVRFFSSIARSKQSSYILVLDMRCSRRSPNAVVQYHQNVLQLWNEGPHQQTAQIGIRINLVGTDVSAATPLHTKQASECPTLWRLYVYLEDEEHERILQARKTKKGLSLGQGGEGYIADDAWCYNCGGSGHWGDVSESPPILLYVKPISKRKDCREFYHPEPLGEPTAFSYHVLSSGPFLVLEHASDGRAPREWMREVPLPGGVENVGRQARRKEMEKLARRAQQQEADDDPTDWFQNSRNAKNSSRGGSERERERIPSGPRGSSSRQPPFKFAAASSSKVSLSDRLTDPAPHDTKDARDRGSRDRASDSRRRNERDNRHERERDKDRRPRYTGGYLR